ncbi:MFS transporter, partial [Bacillus velezensis]|nr:MFS transporter [Bacillus velezensis]
RFGQGIGLGGEWGGAALLATEHAPQGKRGWFGMFPQLGPSVGFLMSNGLFFALALSLSDEQFRGWGWRIPFLIGGLIVPFLFLIRRSLKETDEFLAKRHRPTMGEIMRSMLDNWGVVVAGMGMVIMTTVSFY